MLLLIFALGTTPAFAGFDKKVGNTFCTPFTEIAEKVETCDDNDTYLEEGEKCLDKIDAEEKAVSQYLPAVFSGNKDGKQAAKFAGANQDYAASSAALAYLIGTAKVAEGEIRAYKYSLELPEDFEERDVNQGDEAGYIMSVDCYGTNHENLESLLEDFQTRQKKWEDIKKVADANAAAAGVRESHLGASDSAGNLQTASGKGQGSGGKANLKNPKNGQSDITGVKQDQDKQNQGK
jgi:hypothetical protein